MRGVSQSQGFKLRNLITKLQWISSDKERLIQPHSTLTPEEASIILSFLPGVEPTGVVDKRPYQVPYEDG